MFFDIITNHTADVLDYPPRSTSTTATRSRTSTRTTSPYLDADGEPFDDRDYAAGDHDFPAIDPEASFPYAPRSAARRTRRSKVPAWLNDPTMYHNRGDSTFAGENSEYGDFPRRFSALDDLWTERPEVVDGMIDIYQTWVRTPASTASASTPSST